MRELITAIVTPMLENCEIDYHSMKRLIEQQIEDKVTGIVILGSTGEGASIKNNEKLQLIEFAVNIVNKRIKLIVGLNYLNTQDYLDFITELNNIKNIDALLVSIPGYVKPTQSGIYQHFKVITEKSKHNIILYDVPSRTIIGITDEVIIKLANSNLIKIKGIKDATGNIDRLDALKSKCPAGFKFYSGDDFTALKFMIRGGDGVISVAGNVVAKKLITMINNIDISGGELVLEQDKSLIPLYKFLFIESNPIPVKWGLYKMGIISFPNLRLPLTELSSSLQQEYSDLFKI